MIAVVQAKRNEIMTALHAVVARIVDRYGKDPDAIIPSGSGEVDTPDGVISWRPGQKENVWFKVQGRDGAGVYDCAEYVVGKNGSVHSSSRLTSAIKAYHVVVGIYNWLACDMNNAVSDATRILRTIEKEMDNAKEN